MLGGAQPLAALKTKRAKEKDRQKKEINQMDATNDH